MKPMIIPTLLLLLAASAAACVPDRHSQWEYGGSVPATMQAQVLNPEAGSARPVTGLDGPSAMRAIKRHEMMGEKKPSDGVLESMAKALNGNKGKE